MRQKRLLAKDRKLIKRQILLGWSLLILNVNVAAEVVIVTVWPKTKTHLAMTIILCCTVNLADKM